MEIRDLLTELVSCLTDTFALVDAWFDQPADLRSYRPVDQGWTVDEVLLHIGLTNHFLLILIEKGAIKALNNPQGLDLNAELTAYQFPRDKLAAIGVLHAFPWMRPEHMEPRQQLPGPAVREQLRQQLAQALACLQRLSRGEGLLYYTTMSVNGLGKLNVYEYVYFLAQHARRHFTQMAENTREFAESS
ncbi:DinB family protein [Hymenobacter psoromatis]|uniref:DinB family protein n=1 Tax=Hymenobacter psoromatis TaxID=1484116 RepID=UPI001CBBA4D9|nr:DinB family protein [Hymenobacter psoromatis]